MVLHTKSWRFVNTSGCILSWPSGLTSGDPGTEFCTVKTDDSKVN